MKNHPQLLKKNPVFASFTPPDLDELVRLGSTRSYRKGEKVILYGDVWPYIFLVGSGQIEAIKESGEGRNLRVASFGTGEHFGDWLFFTKTPLCLSHWKYVWIVYSISGRVIQFCRSWFTMDRQRGSLAA
jgi:CRP-like cAMP-binding protein